MCADSYGWVEGETSGNGEGQCLRALAGGRLEGCPDMTGCRLHTRQEAVMNRNVQTPV